MDGLDVKILRLLLLSHEGSPISQDFRKSFRGIARQLAIDEDTVRNRYHRFNKTGLIRNWHIHLNPNVVGLSEAALWLDLPSSFSSHDAVERLRLIPGVFIIAVFHGGLITIFLRYETLDDLGRTTELIRHILNVQNLTRVRILFPESKIRMSRNDWDIVSCLRDNARKSFESISKELGLSSRTVKRRIHRMIQENVLFGLPDVTPKNTDGTIIASLFVAYQSRDKSDIDSKVLAQLDDNVWHLFFTLPETEGDLHYTIFNLAIPSISKASEILEWINKIPGVLNARIELVDEFVFVFEGRDSHIEKALRLTNSVHPIHRENPKAWRAPHSSVRQKRV